MERYSLIVVADETAPIRRYDILKSVVHRALWGAGLLTVLLLVGLVDYVGLRVEQPEFEVLKNEAAAQRARIAQFEATLTEVIERELSDDDPYQLLNLIAKQKSETLLGEIDELF